MSTNRWLCSFALLVAVLLAGTPLAFGAPPEEGFSHKEAFALLKKYCQECHDGNAPEEEPVSHFDVNRVEDPKSVVHEATMWTRVLTRLKDGDMPPPGRPAPTAEQRAALVKWIEASVKPTNEAAKVAPRFAGKEAAQLQAKSRNSSRAAH